MTCHEAKELSSDYLDQRLSPMNIAFVEEHLKLCRDCALEYEELSRTISLIGSLEEIATSPGFLARVNRRIAERDKRRRLWQRLFEPLRIKVPLQAAALCLAAVLGFLLYHRSPELQRYEVVEEAERPSAAGERESPRAPAQPQAPLEQDRGPVDDKAMKERGSAPETAKQEAAPGAPVGSSGPAGVVTAASPRPEVIELFAAAVDRYEREVRAALEEVNGRVLVAEGAPETAVLLTVEVAQSRRAEFLARLRSEQEGEVESSLRARESTPSPPSPAGADEPMARLHLRILPKR